MKFLASLSILFLTASSAAAASTPKCVKVNSQKICAIHYVNNITVQLMNWTPKILVLLDAPSEKETERLS
ncbi:hypothetical protein HYALB_00007683 [Hymenoscyphus albidus]|uniref:Uncharacterized protein n=1 Tax=Hymenoscyphus albidus TaxID=595503 RepID=A0A9N9LIF5_9HELO|nr:hypothetical protein HYALB_00007683 [Hymenoscyphus albidus]